MLAPRPLAAATNLQASLDGYGDAENTPPARVRRGHVRAASSKSNEELRTLVLKLSSKLDELTAIVVEQQDQNRPQPDGAD